jgi:hypothetical protein
LEMMPHACNPSTRDAEAGGSRPTWGQVPVAHAYNPSYLEDWDQEDCS